LLLSFGVEYAVRNNVGKPEWLETEWGSPVAVVGETECCRVKHRKCIVTNMEVSVETHAGRN
jgi:hypothetical protein